MAAILEVLREINIYVFFSILGRYLQVCMLLTENRVSFPHPFSRTTCCCSDYN